MNIFNGKSVYKKMETYMEDKYGEKFTFLQAQGSYRMSGSSTRCATFSSEKFPKAKEIYVYAKKNNEGKYWYIDNYPKYLLGDEIEEHISNLVKPIYGDCKVFIRPDQQPLSENCGPHTTIKELFNDVNINIAIFLNPNANISTKDEDVERFRLKLKEDKIKIYFYLFYMNDKHYDTVNEDDTDSYVFVVDTKKDNRYKAVGIFSNDRSYEFFSKEWR